MTLILTSKQEGVDIEYVPPSSEELEFNMQMAEFDDEWQNAMTREEITNFIITGVKSNPKACKWINFGPYDIKNQARDFGDLNYVRNWNRETTL